jgi:hypothetical protein
MSHSKSNTEVRSRIDRHNSLRSKERFAPVPQGSQRIMGSFEAHFFARFHKLIFELKNALAGV